MAMSVFNKKVNEAIAEMKETPEEWIWVEGYKGTDKDMKCRNYQFSTNKQYDIPACEKIEDCKSGFHLCLNLKDVFNYYSIGNGNRFFRVRALVRKKDFEEYCLGDNKNNNLIATHATGSIVYPWSSKARDKLAARSIVFLYEMTEDEILNASGNDTSGWTDELKTLAITTNPHKVRDIIKTRKLVELGYCEPLAAYFVSENKFEIASAVANQPGLSMDMRVFFIMQEKTRDDNWSKMLASVATMSTAMSTISAQDMAGLLRIGG